MGAPAPGGSTLLPWLLGVQEAGDAVLPAHEDSWWVLVVTVRAPQPVTVVALAVPLFGGPLAASIGTLRVRGYPGHTVREVVQALGECVHGVLLFVFRGSDRSGELSRG